jgi:hypothetical protein
MLLHRSIFRGTLRPCVRRKLHSSRDLATPRGTMGRSEVFALLSARDACADRGLRYRLEAVET